VTRAIALVALLAVLPAQAADYPTKPDEMDKLCEVIGEAPDLSIPPKDRLWFKENCGCIGGTTFCGNLQSNRYASRLYALKAAIAAKAKADAERRAPIEKTERLRQDFKLCKQTGLACEPQMYALDDACKAMGITSWDECLAGK
jgi:hypothetical protein